MVDGKTSTKKVPATLTVGRPTAFTGRTWVRWTRSMKATFLDHLAATCNVKESAAAIGVDPISVYALRRRDMAFLAEWSRALETGYEMLETQLVGHALAGGGTVLTNGAVAITGPIDVDLALRLLTVHRTRMAGVPQKGGPTAQRATREETDRAILKKLAAIERRASGA